MRTNISLLFQIWQDSLINTGHTYSGWIFQIRPFHEFNIFLLIFVGYTEISLVSGVGFLRHCTEFYFWKTCIPSWRFLSALHHSLLSGRFSPTSRCFAQNLHVVTVTLVCTLKARGVFSCPLPLKINLASDVICIVQMGIQDLCRLVHVRRHCAIKCKPSVCWLRAVNWHFADCRLSVSHRQILAGALLLGACRWCHCRGGQSHRPPPLWKVFGPHRGSDGS